MFEIINDCTKIEPEKRPSISIVYQKFFQSFVEDITLPFVSVTDDSFFVDMYSLVQGSDEKCRQLSINFFIEGAKRNNKNAQFMIAEIYEEGKYVQRNVDMAIHYYKLAANQNHLKAQLKLGLI